jgi:prepilin-type N-terminal cleavage/methylation domain-containing protein
MPQTHGRDARATCRRQAYGRQACRRQAYGRQAWHGRPAHVLGGTGVPPVDASRALHAPPAAGGAAAAFTLVEVLVVIGVIGILLGAIALGLSGRGSDGVALANAQSVLSGLVGTARAQAALHQTNARLVVYAQMPPGATADASKYLRTLQVVRQETNAAGQNVWVAAGDPVTLPAPICVVPPPPVPQSHLRLPTGQNWVNNPAQGPVSTGLVTQNAGFAYAGQSGRPANLYFGRQGNGRIHYLEFGPDGRIVSTGNPTKIALAPAVLSGNALPQFYSANTVRGLIIRRTGAVSLVNSATGF